MEVGFDVDVEVEAMRTRQPYMLVYARMEGDGDYVEYNIGEGHISCTAVQVWKPFRLWYWQKIRISTKMPFAVFRKALSSYKVLFQTH